MEERCILRFSHFAGEQIRQTSRAGIRRLLENGDKICFEVHAEGLPTVSGICKSHPADDDEQRKRVQATMETTDDAERVDIRLRAIATTIFYLDF